MGIHDVRRLLLYEVRERRYEALLVVRKNFVGVLHGALVVEVAESSCNVTGEAWHYDLLNRLLHLLARASVLREEFLQFQNLVIVLDDIPEDADDLVDCQVHLQKRFRDHALFDGELMDGRSQIMFFGEEIDGSWICGWVIGGRGGGGLGCGGSRYYEFQEGTCDVHRAE